MAFILLSCLLCCSSVRVLASNRSPSPFAGRWDLTIQAPDGSRLPSWLEVSFSHDAPHARFVGRWGNARELPKVEVSGGHILFVSPKDEEGSSNDLVFDGLIAGGLLHGHAVGSNQTKWTWVGFPAPPLSRPAHPHWGPPQSLFNGADLSGWRLDHPAKAGWRVENGALVNAQPGANLITTAVFADFKLHVEVNCPKDANSGIYLRGRYEVQVEDDSLAEPPSHHMGAIYGFLAPKPEQPRRPGQWQTFDITLLGRYVTVIQNGRAIIRNREIPGITGGALDSDEAAPGPIYLQGDHGPVAYRNLILTPAQQSK